MKSQNIVYTVMTNDNLLFNTKKFKNNKINIQISKTINSINNFQIILLSQKKKNKIFSHKILI
jgi:hypothetical protein